MLSATFSTLSAIIFLAHIVDAQIANVTLDYGTFIGTTNTSTNITSYLGVRFAEEPERFSAAIFPPTTNLGVVNATQFGKACIQTTQTEVDAGTSEDCFFGNVYVPSSATPTSHLPVMVWFHGGGFQGGNSHDASPELLFASSAQQMILVSFEYRLGQFGFLGGAKVKSDGQLNAGLQDQRTALRWVQRYISQFGGDPSRVTIWGESAGAGSTMFQLLGNGGDSENLFRAAMGDSPSLNFMPLWSDDYLEQIFDQVASFAGCNTTSPDVLKCLRSVDVNVLTAAGAKTIQSRPSTLYVFAPYLDEEFIQERPVEAFTQSGKFAKVPVLFGSNTNEGAHWSAGIPDPNANTSMPNSTQQTVYNFIRGQYATFANTTFQSAAALYPLATYNNSFSLQGQQMYGEARYICTAGMITGAAHDAHVPSFQYHYNNPHLGSDHGSDLQAMWNTPSSASASDLAFFSEMREYWTSFVTTGTPQSTSGVEWQPVTSGPASSGSARILLDPSGIKMEEITDQAQRCRFWHSISGELHT